MSLEPHKSEYILLNTIFFKTLSRSLFVFFNIQDTKVISHPVKFTVLPDVFLLQGFGFKFFCLFFVFLFNFERMIWIKEIKIISSYFPRFFLNMIFLILWLLLWSLILLLFYIITYMIYIFLFLLHNLFLIVLIIKVFFTTQDNLQKCFAFNSDYLMIYLNTEFMK